MYPPNLIELFMKLNEHQRRVVDVGEGLACVIGNPGSGKTSSIIARMARLIYDGLPPQYILAMTFTRAAAAEMSDRLKRLGLEGARVGTIHSVCRQILAESRLGLLNSCTVDDKNTLQFELRRVLNDFRRKNRVGWWGVDFEAVTRFISACKAETFSYVSGDPFGLNMRAETQILQVAQKYAKSSGIRPTVLRDIYFEQERRREANGKMDFDDMLQWAWATLIADAMERNSWRHRYAVVIIDETQDSCPVQWDIARLMVGLDSCIKPVKELPTKWQPRKDEKQHNLMVIGDVSQCLAGDTEIVTVEGAKRLETAVAGDRACSSVGGRPIFCKVLSSGSQVKHELVKITTEDGVELIGSTDHIIFLAMPAKADYFYTYVMLRYDMGFRVGTTHGAKAEKANSLRVRLGQEGGDLLWLVAAHASKAEAALHEEQMSLRYGVPTIPFVTAGRDMRLTTEHAKQVFAEFGANGQSILNAHGLLINRPLYISQSCDGKRITITHVIGSTHGSEITIESQALASLAVRQAIKSRVDTEITPGRRGTWRIRRYLRCSAEAQQLVCALQNALIEVLQLPVTVRMTLANASGPNGVKFVAGTLSGALPGLYVWTDQGVAKKIVKQERLYETRKLHDIEIESATNYFANGIAVHNSLYSWRSASPQLFLDFWKQEDVVKLNLPINYRSNKQVCDSATDLVKGKVWHLGGQIVPADQSPVTGKVKTVHYDTVENEAAHVIRKCREYAVSDRLRSCAVLARLKVSLDLAEIECIRHRIKYLKMASGSFFESKETQAILGYLRVANGYDPDGKWLSFIINQPFRFIGTQIIRKAEQAARSASMPLLDTMLGPLAEELTGRQRSALSELSKLLTEISMLGLKAEAAAVGTKLADGTTDELKGPTYVRLCNETGPAAAIGLMLKKTRYMDALRREDGSGRFDESKETAIEALRRISSQFLSHREFLGYVDQIINAVTMAKKTGLRLTEGAVDDALVLSTLHRCKGLGFKHVFIIDATEGTLPCSRSDNLDEELRLLYVGVTRAEDTCEVSWSGDQSANRSIFVKKLATFLGEAGGDLPGSTRPARPAPASRPERAPESKSKGNGIPPRLWENMPKIRLLLGTEGQKNRVDCVNVSFLSAVGFWRTFKPLGNLNALRFRGTISEDQFKTEYQEQLEKLSALTWVDLIGMARQRGDVLQLVDYSDTTKRHAEYIVEFLTTKYPEIFEAENTEHMCSKNSAKVE